MKKKKIVYKFGGKAIATPDLIRNVVQIIKNETRDDLLIIPIISAIGKTTKDLEVVCEEYFKGEKSSAINLLEKIEDVHLQIVGELYANNIELKFAWENVEKIFKVIFDYLEEPLPEERNSKSEEFYKAQMITRGERFATQIIYDFMQFSQEGIRVILKNAKELITVKADQYKNAEVNIEITYRKIKEFIASCENLCDVLIIPGFFGSPENHPEFYSPLGLEGSDYSAGIFASATEAKELIFYKDCLPSNKDPKKDSNAFVYTSITNTDVNSGMFGQLFHSKTFSVPLNGTIVKVKDFRNPDGAETIVKIKK